MSLATPPMSVEMIQQVVKRVTTLATLPEVTAQIVQTVENPRSSAAELHQIVAHDPSMVSRILKVVNSSFYGLPGQIGSIERAIVLLGLNAVKNIAVAASLGQLFRGGRLCDGYTPKDLWKHCIAVAVAARDLARQLKLAVVEEAFLCGMIHDVGILIELQEFSGPLAEVCAATQNGEGSFCQMEERIIGVTHQQLGAALAEQWKFPRSCQLVAAYHHQPQIATGDRVLPTLVWAADILCHQAGQGFSLPASCQTLDDGLMASIGLSEAMVAKTTQSLKEMMDVGSALWGC